MKLIKQTLLLLCLTSSFAYAEHTAPVFDVDSMSNDSPIQDESEAKNLTGTGSAPTITSSSSAPISSATPSSSPLTVEQRLARLEQELQNTEQNDGANRVASMQGEIQALRGQVEELSHRLQELTSQQGPSEADKQQLSKAATEPTMSHLPRVSDDDTISPKTTAAKAKTLSDKKASLAQHAGKTAKVAVAPEKKTVAAVQPNGAEEQAVYQTAYNLIKAKKYNEAIDALQKMLAKYPSGQFAANAHYWLGELYSLTGQHEQAATEFLAVVKHYPSNPRVPDSELKLGLIYATQLKWMDAKSSFTKVVRQYPGSPSARLAMEQLKQLKQAGH